MGMLISTDTIWFSPINVLYHFARLESIATPAYRRSKEFRKAHEAFLTALMLMGIIKLQKQQYWMQLTNDKEATPDIRSFRYVEKNGILNWQDIQEIEVVQYENHSNESISDFIKRKKFPPKKLYPETTIILCYADKTMLLPSCTQLYKDMQDRKEKNPVIILGKTNPEKPTYTICQIHPVIDLYTEYDAVVEAHSRKYDGVLKVSFDPKGKPNFIYNPHEKHYPFEVLGVKTK